jgi:hypothetical protein
MLPKAETESRRASTTLLSLSDDELAARQDRISGDYLLTGHAADNAKSEWYVADIVLGQRMNPQTPIVPRWTFEVAVV